MIISIVQYVAIKNKTLEERKNMSIIESIFVRPREKNYFDYLNPNEEDRLNGMVFPGEFLTIVDLFSNDYYYHDGFKKIASSDIKFEIIY